MLLQPVVEEEVILLPGHAVVHQIFVHLAVDAAAVIEIEAEEAAGVQELRRVDRGAGCRRGNIPSDLALDEDGVGPALQYLDHRQHVGLDDMLERGDEAAVVRHLLVPPAVFGGEDRADEHLVDRRVELHPGEALGEGAGIGGEELREIRILEIADPVRHSEMAQIDDRRDVAPLQLGEGEVGEFPVIFAGAEQGAVERRSVAQEMDAELLDAVEIRRASAGNGRTTSIWSTRVRPSLIVGMLFSIPVANMKLAMESLPRLRRCNG